MTTITPRSIKIRSRSGFTLAELLVTLIVLSLILGAVFAAFLFFNKSGINIGNYVDMDRQARSALEKFAVDARMAASITTFGQKQVTLIVPLDDTGGTYTVTYNFFENSHGTPSLRRTFARQVTESTNTTLVPIDGAPVPLVQQLTLGSGGLVTARFRYYRVGSPTGATASSPTIPPALNALETKQINIDLETERIDPSRIVARASNVVLSARFVLRNKVVVN